jgi:hypothetical protein
VNSRELFKRKDLGMDHTLLPPEAQLERSPREVGDHMDFDFLPDGNARHRDRGVVEVDAAVSVHGSCLAEAEDIFGGGKRSGESEGSKEAVAGSESSLEADMRDLARGRMNPLVVVSIDFLAQNGAQFVQSGDFFSGGCSDDPVLEPAIGAFDFAFGLRREGIDDINAEEGHSLLPLRVDIVCFKDGFIPEAVPVADEAEDAEGIDIILQRHAIAADQGFRGLEMRPGCFLFEEVGKKDFATEIVKGRDQGPLRLGIGRPAVERGVVLDEGADGCRDDLAAMGLLFWPGSVAAQDLGALDDRRESDFKPEIVQPFSNGGVVEGRDRQVGILDHNPFLEETFSDQGLGVFGQSKGRVPMVGQGKASRIFPVELEQGKEPGFANTQSLLDLGPVHVAFCIGAKQILNLFVGKTSVNVCHIVLLPEDYNSGVHFSTLNCSLFNPRQHTVDL